MKYFEKKDLLSLLKDLLILLKDDCLSWIFLYISDKIHKQSLLKLGLKQRFTRDLDFGLVLHKYSCFVLQI